MRVCERKTGVLSQIPEIAEEGDAIPPLDAFLREVLLSRFPLADRGDKCGGLPFLQSFRMFSRLQLFFESVVNESEVDRDFRDLSAGLRSSGAGRVSPRNVESRRRRPLPRRTGPEGGCRPDTG